MDYGACVQNTDPASDDGFMLGATSTAQVMF
jgi:hypothetical protein